MNVAKSSKKAWMALVVAAVLGSAQAGNPPATYRVAVADLDLGSAGGIAALYGRLQTAARAVCGLDEAHGYAERQHARRCVTATMDGVVTELRHANLLD